MTGRTGRAPKVRFIPAQGAALGFQIPTPRLAGLKARFTAMSQSLSLIAVHIVFSTKERRPFIRAEIRPRLYAYLSVVAREAGCEAYRVGGVADHVHLAVRLSRTKAAAALIEELKTSSSKWMKVQWPELSNFAWQRGYSCFSVRPSDIRVLVAYIDDQENHHRTRTFQEELRAFLKKYGVEHDERFLWD